MFEQRNFEEMEDQKFMFNNKSDNESSNQEEDRQTAEYDFASEKKFQGATSNDQISPFGGQHLRLNSKIRGELEQTLKPKLGLERLMEQGYNLDHRGNLFDGSDIDRLRSSVGDDRRREFSDEKRNESHCESILSSKMKSFANNLSQSKCPSGPDLNLRRAIASE